MNRAITNSLVSLVMLALGVGVPTTGAYAQQKQTVSYKTPAEGTKYTQQHAVDVGDVPGHQIRIYELHRTFPSVAPVINDIKVKEIWSRNTSDYVDGNGPGTFYSEYTFQNGDKLEPALDDILPADQYSREIELATDGKFVYKIEFQYRTLGNITKGRANMLVFGKRYTGF